MIDRRERWRIDESWRLRREIVIETRNPPQPGWDAHLQPETYQEPEGTNTICFARPN